MKKSVKELEKIANELRETIKKMSAMGEEGSCMIQEGFKKVMSVTMSAPRLGASVLFDLPDQIHKIVRDLKDYSQPDGQEQERKQ